METTGDPKTFKNRNIQKPEKQKMVNHLKTKQFTIRLYFDHSKTRHKKSGHVRFSDPHCNGHFGWFRMLDTVCQPFWSDSKSPDWKGNLKGLLGHLIPTHMVPWVGDQV